MKRYDVRGDFKWSINAGSFQFLAGVFPHEKEISIVSKNLSYELTLIDFYQHAGRLSEVQDLKEHAEKVAAIPLEKSPLVIDYVSAKCDLPDLSDSKFHEVNDETIEETKKLMEVVKEYKKSLFEKSQ